jgi:hypothetical protein
MSRRRRINYCVFAFDGAGRAQLDRDVALSGARTDEELMHCCTTFRDFRGCALKSYDVVLYNRRPTQRAAR